MNAIDFIHRTRWEDIPEAAQAMTRRCLLDTVAAGLGARRTELSQIIFEFAASNYGGRGALLWLDGREVSLPGAALANGMTVDALDIHDGHMLTKGHAGAALVPAVVTLIHDCMSGEELLATLAVGYEISIRAGMALHQTACDYHTSGAWNALGCAAMAARTKNLSAAQTRHALGIAEYHGPRSPMMRCIDHPTMLKDGSGWGAMAGLSAALMAELGLTGAPALTVEDSAVAQIWGDLGSRWRITEQYFKPYAVCYWAQAAIAGTLAVMSAHQLSADSIKRIVVHTFHEATRLSVREPSTTEEAQYSLPFPVAAAAVHGQLGPAQLSGNALRDPAVLALAGRVQLVEDDGYNARFPAERLARIEIETNDGATHGSGEQRPKWQPHQPATDEDLRQKFRWLARDAMPEPRAELLLAALWQCHLLPKANEILPLLCEPNHQ